VCSSIFHF